MDQENRWYSMFKRLDQNKNLPNGTLSTLFRRSRGVSLPCPRRRAPGQNWGSSRATPGRDRSWSRMTRRWWNRRRCGARGSRGRQGRGRGRTGWHRPPERNRASGGWRLHCSVHCAIPVHCTVHCIRILYLY